MEVRIETLAAKKLIGKKLTMTYAENKTFDLWKSFMPHRKEITNNISADLFSMQVYDPSFNFLQFDLYQPFVKWAAVETSDYNFIPPEMETFNLESGLYAVFFFKGLSTDTQIFQYIFGTWIPDSAYVIDNRPHFEILGAKYKNNDPNSEEEIWIPIKKKG
jgi:AraC family transcriptional regulator